MTKLKTIKVSGGGDYAKVSERLKEFHRTYPNGNISTDYKSGDQLISFKAIITPDTSKPERFFTGHSLGKNGQVKAFEKLETIAVGRALAFLGLLADGDVASADEMEEYSEEGNGKEAERLSQIEELKIIADGIDSIEELREFYSMNKGMGKEFDRYIVELSKKLKEKNENT